MYLSASRSDSTSLSLLEAMASGAVPVVGDIEGNREWIEDGAGGRLFTCGDAADLALEQVLADGSWVERARAHNRRVAEVRGDWSRNMAVIETHFEAVVRAAPPVRAAR